MSDSASRSAAASDVSGSSRLPSTIEKSHLADSGNDSFISSDCELSAGGGDHARESPQPQPARDIVAPLQDHLVHATADLASLAENDDRSRGYEPNREGLQQVTLAVGQANNPPSVVTTYAEGSSLMTTSSAPGEDVSNDLQFDPREFLSGSLLDALGFPETPDGGFVRDYLCNRGFRYERSLTADGKGVTRWRSVQTGQFVKGTDAWESIYDQTGGQLGRDQATNELCLDTTPVTPHPGGCGRIGDSPFMHNTIKTGLLHAWKENSDSRKAARASSPDVSGGTQGSHLRAGGVPSDQHHASSIEHDHHPPSSDHPQEGRTVAGRVAEVAEVSQLNPGVGSAAEPRQTGSVDIEGLISSRDRASSSPPPSATRTSPSRYDLTRDDSVLSTSLSTAGESSFTGGGSSSWVNVSSVALGAAGKAASSVTASIRRVSHRLRSTTTSGVDSDMDSRISDPGSSISTAALRKEAEAAAAEASRRRARSEDSSLLVGHKDVKMVGIDYRTVVGNTETIHERASGSANLERLAPLMEPTNDAPADPHLDEIQKREKQVARDAIAAQELAAQGIRCLHFDPVGRGASWGHDDFAGLEGQDSLRTVLDFIHSLRRVKGDRVGVISFSSGLALAVPCLAREGRRLGTRFLIDWEGPASRHELLRGGPLPSTARSAMARDPDAFWALREPISWIDKLPCHYLRIQGPSQQSQGAGDEHAALQLVSAATQGQAGSTRLWGNPRDTSWRIEQHSDLRWAPHEAGPLNRVLIQSTLEMSGIDPSGADSPS